MKTMLGWMALTAALLATSAPVEACTATSSMDVARELRGSDSYKAARDVAREFVDRENWTRDVPTSVSDADKLLTDCGAGTLLKEAVYWWDDRTSSSRGIPYLDAAKGSISKSEIEGILDQPGISTPHGMKADGTVSSEVTTPGDWGSWDNPATVREHMRLHIAEVRNYLAFGVDVAMLSVSIAKTRDAWTADAASGAESSSAPPASEPAPSVVAEPAPAPEPVKTSPTPESVAAPAPAPSPVEGPAPEPEPLSIIHRAG